MRAPLFLLAVLCLPAAGAETVLGGRLLGGRHLAAGRPGAFSGQAAASAAAAFGAEGPWTLLPTVSGGWNGVESALDTPGGTTLFQEAVDARAAVKGLYRRPDARWSLKPSAGWRMRLLKETRDEAWFSGLFDHHVVDAGLEWEFAARQGAAVRVGYAFSRTLFANYESLESSAPTDPRGRPLARELAGRKVLDSDAHLLTLGLGGVPAAGLRGEGRLGFERRGWRDQRLVLADGSLGAQKRTDLTTTLEAALSWDRDLRLDRTLTLALDGSVSGTVSNQASFDPARGRYEPRRYNNTAWRLGPSAGLRWGDRRAPVSATLGASVGGRSWPHRSARDAAGAYTGQGLRERTFGLAAEGRWPLGPALALSGRAERLWASSNDRYGAAHRFNHQATSLLFGAVFER